MVTNVNRTLSGNNGTVWVNGQRDALLTKIELKITGSFEDLKFCGDTGTYPRFTGWAGEGTLTRQKADSAFIAMLADAYKKDDMPEVKIITKLTDSATQKSERVAVTGVVFTEFMLAGFEKGSLIEEELPFKFSDYEVLETIG